MDGEVDGIAQVAGGGAQVVDEQREPGGQRERDADDHQREQRGQRRARQPAQRAEQRLQMARAVRGNRAAHVRRSMFGQIGELRRLRGHARGVTGVQRVRGDAAGIEHDLALAELLDQVRVVRGDDHGDADFLEALEHAHDLDAQSPGSRLPVGSSAISSCGLLTTARAMPTRCCSPTDSSSGEERSRPNNPTWSSAARTRRSTSLSGVPATTSGSATLS